MCFSRQEEVSSVTSRMACIDANEAAAGVVASPYGATGSTTRHSAADPAAFGRADDIKTLRFDAGSLRS